MVKAYHLLNEFKNTKVKIETPVINESGLVFAQNKNQTSQDKSNKKEKEPYCYGCGKKGCTIVSCPDCKAKNRNKNKGDEQSQMVKKDKSQSTSNKEKRLTFEQDVDSDNSDTDGSQFGIGCFCTNDFFPQFN